MSGGLKKNLDTINKNFSILQKNYHVKSIGIFGSFAKSEQVEKSDIDILVELDKPMGFLKFLELEEFLSKILKRKVDLATKRALKHAIKKNVLKDIIYV